MSEIGEGPSQDSAPKVDYRDYKFIGGKVAGIDQRVGEQGFVGAIHSLLEERGIHINPVMSEATQETLATKPTAVIGIHPDIDVNPCRFTS